MNKLEKIDYIKRIIKDFGSFTPTTVEALSSPRLSVEGNVIQLLEGFYEHRVEVVSYSEGKEIDSEKYSYEELPEHVIEEVLVLANSWMELQLEY